MSRLLMVWAATAVLSTPAAAKPLPPNMKVTLKKGQPYITVDKVTARLLESFEGWEHLKAELSDDGATLQLFHDLCGMTEDDADPLEIPMRVVEAKLDNVKAMGLHRKKKYADAAKLFEQAWTKDKATPLYATNWLSALVMGGEVERADKLLADGLAKGQTGWFAWRLAVDPELAKLKGMAGAKSFVAAKPSKLTLAKLGEGVAVSPLGLAALVTSDPGRQIDEETFVTYLSIVELASGRESLRLPLQGSGAKAASMLLSMMGFEVRAKALKDPDQVKNLPEAAEDSKWVADIGSHIVYIARTAGCGADDPELRAFAVKR